MHESDISVVVRAIREVHPGVKLLIRSGLPPTRILGVSSADGYVAKAQEPESLWQAIEELAERE